MQEVISKIEGRKTMEKRKMKGVIIGGPKGLKKSVKNWRR